MPDKIVLNINKTVFGVLAENIKVADAWHSAVAKLKPRSQTVTTLADDDVIDKLCELGLMKRSKSPNKVIFPKSVVFAVFESDLRKD